VNRSSAYVLAASCCLLSQANVLAAPGYTPWAVPTQVQMTSGGILVSGAFGNLETCTYADHVFYHSSYAQYNVVVSMVMAAIAAKQEIRFYVSGCMPVGFIWGGNTSAVNGSADGNGVAVR
jgi:hypothetical protein